MRLLTWVTTFKFSASVYVFGFGFLILDVSGWTPIESHDQPQCSHNQPQCSHDPPYCSHGLSQSSHDYFIHDPISSITTKSPTPTQRYNSHGLAMILLTFCSLPFGVGLELTLPSAPPASTKNDILDLLDCIPNVTNPLGVSPSPPKLLPHRLYWLWWHDCELKLYIEFWQIIFIFQSKQKDTELLITFVPSVVLFEHSH